LPNALHVACALGELNTAENTAERIGETINIWSRLVGCGCSSNIMHISSLPLENFDFGIFTLFLFTVFSYSFDIAPDRSCNISIFSEAAIQYGDIKFRADIEIPKDLSNKDITLMSSKLHTYLRRICAINNIPLSFIADICVSIEIIPVRPEVSLLGLKEEEFYLRGSLSKDSDIIS
ncbi:MAG: hypothetical protein U0M06_14665, partial [Clostridia bacterium]|nr:hypothetical protein [Clostridia bacterium]